jgi:L-threonylcarbamoyladenylate synthase
MELEMRSKQAMRLETCHLSASQPGVVNAAAELLKQGHLIVFPTDTLYGIGADAFNQVAISRLYQIKRRSLDKGIPILLADLSDVDKVAHHLPPVAQDLIARFWPGPLTLIVPKHPALPAVISPNDGIAIRIPRSKVARDLIRLVGGAVATSSANLSGHTPCRTGAQAMDNLGGLVTAVLDGGPCPESMASTIVDCRGRQPILVRQGPISSETLSLTGTVPS